jgi:tRNA A-37 threonylcarbamoyl transferase component Bud32
LAAVAGIVEDALEKLSDLIAPAERVAVCAYGPAVFAKPGATRGQDLLVLCDGYSNGLRAHLRVYDGEEFRFLIADRTLVESDVEKGTLGDYLTEQFLYPYHPVLNIEYLDKMAERAKTRVAEEEARDLVIEFREMCRGLVAAPEFFGLSRMRKLARVSVPSMTAYLRLLEEPVRERNLMTLRSSFKTAFAATKGEVLKLEGEHVSLEDSAVDRWLKDRVSEQVVNVLRQSQRAFYSYLAKGRAIYLSPDLLTRELYSPLKLTLDTELNRMDPEDPKNYLFLRTSAGLVPLGEKAPLDEVIANLHLGGPITITPLAGVLNEVFLVTAGKEQLVVKKFTDWDGFKWFTLNLVSLGSKLFAVSGKARMTNEYGMNRYLGKRGLKVANIIYLNVKQRILVERYLSGPSFADLAKEAVNQSSLTKGQAELAESLGETLADIHEIGVSVGDTKPENYVINDGKIFTVDLEQAGKRKDYAWDIAELLFYTGHYRISPTFTGGLKGIIEAIVTGYSRKGDPTELRKAAAVRYAKVFSIWTPAPVILEISRILREAR